LHSPFALLTRKEHTQCSLNAVSQRAQAFISEVGYPSLQKTELVYAGCAGVSNAFT